MTMRSKNMCTSISPRIPSRYQYAANDYLHEDESCNMHYLFSKKSAIVIHATCFTPANDRHEDYSQPTHDTKLQNSIKGLLHKLLHISSSKRVLHEHLVGNVQLAHHFSQSLAIILSIWSGIWLPIWKEVVMDHR